MLPVVKPLSALAALRTRYDSLGDRIDSTDGLASTNGDVLNMRESAVVEPKGAIRDLGEMMNGYESSNDVLNAQFRNQAGMWPP